MKDKLWFYGAFRHARYDKPIANTFFTPTGVPYPAGLRRSAAAIRACEQGVSDEKMDNPIARLTWQMSPRNKFAAYNDRAMRLRGHAMSALTDPRDRLGRVAHADLRDRFGEMDVDGHVAAAVRRRLLVQPRALRQRCIRTASRQERDTPAWYAERAQERQQPGSAVERAARRSSATIPTATTSPAAASYVTGSHNIKVGLQDAWGPYRRYNNANADLYQIYNNRRPLHGDGAQHAARRRRSIWTPTSASTRRTRGA